MKGRLILHCVSLPEKGVGSAWGLPVIQEGDRRLSARAASERLSPLGEGDPLAEEGIRDLEDAGVGPLGRYLGGERIAPVRLGPGDFFGPALWRGYGPGFTALEFEDPRWRAEGTTEELFHDHLEFLRAWGFSGGLYVEASKLAELLGAYLLFLRRETAGTGAAITALVPRDLLERGLRRTLKNAKPFGDPGAGEIPVNFAAGGEPVLGGAVQGLGLAIYEDLPPSPGTGKAPQDILILAAPAPAASPGGGALNPRARLKLTIGSPPPPGGTNAPPSLNAYLFRDLTPVGPGGKPRVLPFPKTGGGKTAPGAPDRVRLPRISPPRPGRRAFSGNPEEAAALFGGERRGTPSPWGADRVEAAAGGLFAVTAKFSGLRAADFKEEQVQFYREGSGRVWTGPAAPPPVRPGAAFTELDERQREYFLRWRAECRRAVPEGRRNRLEPLPPGDGKGPPEPARAAAYARLYARELLLSMGREGPQRHFLALRDLFRARRGTGGEGETGMEASLARWLLDFTVIYGIAAEALPLLLEELWNDAGWYNRARNGGGGGEETAGLLLNLSLYHFFIEKDAPPAWPLVKPLLPPKILQRKEGTPGEGIDAPGEPWEQAARTLEALDRRLREDWGRGFFAFFCPPRPVKAEFKAFRGLGGMGESSYTACWLDFSSHKPLIEALSALALNPLASPLPGVKIRPRPLGLEGELVEELRRESEEVRDLLKTGAPEEAPPRRERPAAKGLSGPGYGFSGLKLTGPPVLSRSVLEDFLAGLGDTERDALRKIVTNAGGGVPDLIVNGINEAFYGRFGDILVESSPAGPSISAGYGSILMEWE